MAHFIMQEVTLHHGSDGKFEIYTNKMIQISDFDWFMIWNEIYMYFSVISFKKILEPPRDWVTIFLSVFAFVTVGRIVNHYIEIMDLPWIFLILLFVIFTGLAIKVYMDFKNQKKYS
jgi:hypothetical protein